MPRGFSNKPRIRLAVLISGSGTNLANILARIQSGDLPGVEIGLVISSRSNVGGVDVAREAAIPLRIIRRRDFENESSFSDAITDAITHAEIDLVVMAGFLCFWRIPVRFQNRVLNIHPSLLPAFGGRGMYGRLVHQAVLAGGAHESGCTVHIADNEYDHGPIVDQRKTSVVPGESVESLAQRVAALERELYPDVIRRIQINGVAWLDQVALGMSTLPSAPID